MTRNYNRPWRDYYLLELISKMSQQDEDAPQLNESQEVGGVKPPSNNNPAKLLEPGKEAFHFPASPIGAKLSSVPYRICSPAPKPVRCNDFDSPSSFQALVQRVAVTGFVSEQTL